ncbi:MAG: hypothetical protein ORN28_11480 [Rhodoferax sp.]|nr:hypothetical protein [Rhodoferax sp.]
MLYRIPRVVLAFLTLCLALCLALVACGGSGSKADAPAGGIQVVAGNGQVTVTWQESPGVDYWLAYAQTATPLNIGNLPANHLWQLNIHSPFVLTGLSNGLPYSFALNARRDGGPGGAQTPSQSATPRYAGISGSWTAGTALGNSDLRALTYDGGHWIAVGDGGLIYKSADGATWTPVPSPATGSNNLRAVLYVNATIGYVLSDANKNLYRGTDLANLTANPINPSSNINALATDGSTMVAVGDGGTIQTSTDGSNWTNASIKMPPASSVSFRSVATSNGSWVAVGDAGAIYVSTDSGTTWTAPSNYSPVASGAFRCVAGIGSMFVAVGDAGAVVSSKDGISWTAATMPTLPSTPFASSNLYAVNAASGQFLAVGEAGAAFTSPDLVTWTPQPTGLGTTPYALAGSPSAYYAVGMAGSNAVSK